VQTRSLTDLRWVRTLSYRVWLFAASSVLYAPQHPARAAGSLVGLD
jgi:hypothetical protein